MAKKDKNLEKAKIQWDGDIVLSELASSNLKNKGQSVPTNINLGVWSQRFREEVWRTSGCHNSDISKCASGVMDDPVYFEDYNIWDSTVNNYSYNVAIPDTNIDTIDAAIWGLVLGRTDIQAEINAFIASGKFPEKIPANSYTWGDVSFVVEIADGIGSGSRRARQAKLNEFDEFKKKKLIRLICRVKGEKVYDEEKEVGEVEIKLEDAELVIKEVLGKIKVEKTNVL